MKRRHLIPARLLVAALIGGSVTVIADESKPKLPQMLTVACSLDAYAFKPNRKSWHIDQIPSGQVKVDLVLQRHDRRMAFGGAVPGWKGSKTVDLKGGYTVRLDAHYLLRQPMGDFVGKPSGLTIDVHYFYKEKLIGYSTEAVWREEKELTLSTTVSDTAYVAAMNEKGFAIPSQFAGYANGFRYWAAVRDGLKAGDKGLTYDSLSSVLAPLGRDDNLMMPAVTVNCTVTRPTGSDIPAANLPEVDRPMMRR